MDQHSIWNFLNERHSPEADRIADYLKRNPEVLDRYLSSHEWNETDPYPMPEQFWEEVWLEMEKKRKSSARVVWLKRLTAAAAVVAAALMLYVYYFNPRQPEPVIATIQPAVSDQKTVVNQTGHQMSVYLPDSSLVVLDPQAEIVYTAHFSPDKRNVSLQGRARFDVVKDKERPFTVFAGGLATTALGTAFTIDSRASENIRVQLHNGKVVIRQAGNNGNNSNAGDVSSAGNTGKVWEKEVYLSPGEQLDYNFITMTASVKPIAEERTVSSPAPARKRKSAPKPVEEDENEMVFVNSPLTDVISRLAKQFNTQIVYNNPDITESNFTGSFSPSDSVGIILKIIAQMNSLEVLETEEGYELRKLKE